MSYFIELKALSGIAFHLQNRTIQPILKAWIYPGFILPKPVPICFSAVQVDLPVDPDGAEHYPSTVSFAANAGHVAICFSSGALVIYEVNLPEFYYASSSKQNSPATEASEGTTVSCAPYSKGILKHSKNHENIVR